MPNDPYLAEWREVNTQIGPDGDRYPIDELPEITAEDVTAQEVRAYGSRRESYVPMVYQGRVVWRPIGSGSGTGTGDAAGTAGASVTNATIDGSGHLILTLSDGSTIDAGLVQGTSEGGTPTAGADGVSVTGATINGSGHLILQLSDGSTIDAGLARGPAGAAATLAATDSGNVAANVTTTSTAYTALTGDPQVSVTVPSSGSVMVIVHAHLYVQGTGVASPCVGVAVSGATTRTPSDDLALIGETVQASGQVLFLGHRSVTFVLTGLNPGATTFSTREKMLNDSGMGPVVGFSNRHLSVVPLP